MDGIEVDDYETITSIEQVRTESLCARLLAPHFYGTASGLPLLESSRQLHVNYLRAGLARLPASFACLDASRPWLCYWIIHSLALLKDDFCDEGISQCARFLAHCQAPTGGFCGGPGQLPHLATTYAAVNALVTLGSDEALTVINRTTLLSFLQRMRKPNGSFQMHDDGEVDVRAAYCAVSVAHLCGLASEALFAGTAEWIAQCQTYEGGIGGEPGVEAHGGYTFCGVAALRLLGRERDVLRVDACVQWLAMRQMRLEGGFQGRTNKLVDGCYSFWQGGAFAVLHESVTTSAGASAEQHCLLCNVGALQRYILVCCQDTKRGGLVDKPGKSRDFYHTCYCLSGLSAQQHAPAHPLAKPPAIGVPLAPIDVLHNVVVDRVVRAKHFYSNMK